jgi:hypothetical protein
MFKINGINYDIENAYLDAQLDDHEENVLIIGLQINGKQVDDNTLPFVSSETLLKVKKNEIRKWQDIAGKIIEWGKYSKNICKPHMKFNNCYKKSVRGNFIYNAKIEFKNIENKIFVKINGLCDSKFNGKEIKTLSLDIETEIKLECITLAEHKTEEESRNRLQPYLNTENWEYSTDKLVIETNNKMYDMGKFTLKEIKE